ncbi:toll-interacting protein B-like [Uloborus diversus]|uniref:toll-interacting protein B-like n=1 Tax=Uloborus diversus TaxID=327109 RepID=UPI00240A1D4F|nr:toll-interacting protein B-like [Uloborus diversus]
MASAKYVDRRKNLMVGNLPDDFLRVSQNDSVDRQPNARATRTQAANPYTLNASSFQITLCIVQAQLTKNYSLTKMDPYVRVRIGHSVYETHADVRGGKFPNWNKVITSYLPKGIKTIYIEVFDEHTITSDERIAYGEYTISEEAMQGKFEDTWVPLSGRQGEGKEGSINITVYITPAQYAPPVMPMAAPVMVVQQPVTHPYYIPAQSVVPYPVGSLPMQAPMVYPGVQQPAHRPAPPSEEDIKQLQDIFPSYDREVILGVLESSGGNKDQAISSLLELSGK